MARDRSRPPTFSGLLTAWLLGLIELAGGLVLAVWLLAWPPVFRAYSPSLIDSPHREDAQSIVEWLAGDEKVVALNSRLKSGQLTRKELHHFADVQQLFHRLPSIFAAAVLFSLVLVWMGKPSLPLLKKAQWRGMFLLLLLTMVAAVFAVWDWKTFFAWMHYPLFGETSWKLPKSAYSLRLFPPAFWKTVGAAVLLGSFTLLSGIGFGLKLWEKWAPRFVKSIPKT